MYANFVISELKRNKKLFKDLLRGLPEEMYSWKPSPQQWSLLEIVCHLFDEEREDFRARVQQVLRAPELPLPAIDPTDWVISRQYLDQDFDAKLKAFLEEREQSVNWLHELEDPIWEKTVEHDTMGPVQAKMFFINWLAHDYLHLRQITKVKYEYLKQSTQESLAYAGDW